MMDRSVRLSTHEHQAVAASSPVWGHASRKAAVALAEAVAVATAARNKASINRDRHKPERQDDPDGSRNKYGKVGRRQIREYAKYCRVAAAAMYKHYQDHYGGHCGFWEAPAVRSSLGHWSSFPLIMGERRNTNADEHAGVNVAEIQRFAQLEREASIRTLAMNIAAAAFSAAAPAEARETPTMEGDFPEVVATLWAAPPFDTEVRGQSRRLTTYSSPEGNSEGERNSPHTVRRGLSLGGGHTDGQLLSSRKL
jgi:hypothetical protein